jgi:hypothetical protein
MPGKGDRVTGTKGLTATSWSLRGQHRAYKYAEEVARSVGQATACPTCVAGACRRNCAISDVSYGWQFLWTRCTVTFDVYCDRHG